MNNVSPAYKRHPVKKDMNVGAIAMNKFIFASRPVRFLVTLRHISEHEKVCYFSVFTMSVREE